MRHCHTLLNMPLDDFSDIDPAQKEMVDPSKRRLIRIALGGAAAAVLPGCTFPQDIVVPDFNRNAQQYGEALNPLAEVPGDLWFTVTSVSEFVWNPIGGSYDAITGNQDQNREYIAPAGSAIFNLGKAAIHTVNGAAIVVLAGVNTVYLVVKNGSEILYDEVQMRREKNGWVYRDGEGQVVAVLDSLPQGSIPDAASIDMQRTLDQRFIGLDRSDANELITMQGGIPVSQELVLHGDVAEYHNSEGKDFAVFLDNAKVRLTHDGLIVQGERFNEAGWFTVAYDFDRRSIILDSDGSVVARTPSGYLIVDTDGNVVRLQNGAFVNHTNDDLPYVHQNLTTAQK